MIGNYYTDITYDLWGKMFNNFLYLGRHIPISEQGN